jgi:putative peptide zinc metalloprotease protein
MEAARAFAERHGSPDDRPALRKDILVRRQVQMGDVAWIVKNTETIKYYMFRDAEWRLIKLFDGTRTREEILAEYNRHVRNPAQITLVLNFEERLRRMELIERSATERSLELLERMKSMRERKAEEKSEGFNPFFIRFHVLDPERFLQRTVKYVRWIWTPPVVLIICIASAWTVGVFVLNAQEIWAGTLQLYHFAGKPLIDILQFFVILSIVGAIHEFAHAYVVTIYGGEVHDIGMALFYFTPAFYTDTSDAFMFPNKFHKLYTNIAGIYVEGGICSAATILWVFSYPDTYLHELAYKTMLLTGFATVFCNINPLIKVDGYNALSSLLQLPGMREGSFRMISTLIQKHVFRLPVEVPPMSRRKKWIFWIYGVLSICYTATVMLLISGWISNFYNKYFPRMAVVLIILSLFFIFRKRVRQVTRIVKLFYLDKKELLMSPRSRIPLMGAAAAILLILFVPWSHRTISAEAVLRPADRVNLQSSEDAIVSEVLVREGDTVERGQPVLRLTSPAVEEAARRLSVERERFERESSQGRTVANASQTYQAERRGMSARVGLRNAELRRRDLLIRSPIAGRILTHRPEDLTGRFVVAGRDLVEIGDCRKMAADVGVSERLLVYLRTGASVSALIRTSPTEYRRGSVTTLSTATAGTPATAAAGKDPAAPSAFPDRFTAVAVFDNSDGALLPGAAARVKIRSNREAYALRTWSVFWRWLRTIVW